jgi:L-erythro-3,5-diaminohexanoate dehydrogenase
MIKKGDFYGFHRVLNEEGVLPQGAKKLDNDFSVKYDNEYLIEVEKLNIDAASFKQIKESVNSDKEAMKKKIMEIVKEKGKMQNPVTGSGGVLIGTITYVGENIKNPEFKLGDKIVTLVSLSLTPLSLSEVTDLDLTKDRVFVKGEAVLFESGIASVIDPTLPESLSMALLDVAGAPAQAKRLVQKDQDLVVLGTGKSGLLVISQARQQIGNGKIIAIDLFDTNKDFLLENNYIDHFIVADAKKPIEVYNKIKEILPNLADLVINTANVPDTEMASIMPVKDEGIVYLFNMASNFQKAALGAEGVAKDITIIVGNGYAKNHAKITYDLIKSDLVLKDFFMNRYN